MRTVAEWFVFGVPAPAQADYSAARKAEFLALGVVDGEVAFDADGPIIENCDFRWHLSDASRSKKTNTQYFFYRGANAFPPWRRLDCERAAIRPSETRFAWPWQFRPGSFSE